MNRYIQALGLVFLMNGGFSYIQTAPASGNVAASQATYDIRITGHGAEALVQAIHKYSYLTKADVDRWKYSWVPGLGDYVRGRIMDRIRNFVTVCNSLYFVRNEFQTSQDIMRQAPSNWTSQRICLALNDLYKQADYALALFGDLGAITFIEKQWENAINGYFANIRENKKILACPELKVTQKDKAAKKLKEEEHKLKYNKLWWQNMHLRWKVTTDIGSNLFKGAKWLAQTAQEYSAPLLSAGAVLFAYNKLFGLPQTPNKK
jgi:hypothetical protein